MEKTRLGFMVDCSRNAVVSVSGAKRLIDALGKMGYNMLMLYTEDTYLVDGYEHFGYMRGAYTKDELREMEQYAKTRGIELVPCIQTLAHLNQIFRWKEFREFRDCDDILLAEDERTYALIDAMLTSLRESFSGDIIHIGMDEAHNIGRGRYKDIHGECDRFGVLSRHLCRVCELCKKHGFSPIMWSDMFFRLANRGAYYLTDPSVITQRVIDSATEDVGLVYWDYYRDKKEQYDTMIEAHKRFGKDVWFAGGAWTWTGFAPHNKVSISRTAEAMKACREGGVDNIFFTSWGDDGSETSYMSVLPTLFWAAEIYRQNTDEALIKERFFELFGVPFDDFMKLDLPCAVDERYENSTANSDKVLFYNDPFMGLFDTEIEKHADISEKYESYARKLSSVGIGTEYEYLFKCSSALCSFLAVKSTLGKRIRAEYEKKDKDELSRLVSEIEEAISRLDAFYALYRKAWLGERKGSGFEIQDIRIGGLRMRLFDCKMRIEEYISGEIDTIDDLNQPTSTVYNSLSETQWANITTANKVKF